MEIYDVTKEVLSAEVFPGDPIPCIKPILQIEKGDLCNLSEISLGSHSGTHMDAPKHFINNGRGIESISLLQCVGPCVVVSDEEDVSLDRLVEWVNLSYERILIKGNRKVTEHFARDIVMSGMKFLGIEGLSVGDENNMKEVHELLLLDNIVILESLVLEQVPTGFYTLVALPLKIAGADGAPCRVILTKEES